jgi:hypothetical protein
LPRSRRADRSSFGPTIGSQVVGPDQVKASLAGAGLSGGAGSALSVNVDNSGIEIDGDTLRLKDGGVNGAKLAASVVDDSTLERYDSGAGVYKLRAKDGGITPEKMSTSARTQYYLVRSIAHTTSSGLGVSTAGGNAFVPLTAPSATAGTATEANSQTRMPKAGTIREIIIDIGANTLSAVGMDAVVRIGGVSQVMKCDVDQQTGRLSFTGGPLAFAAGDLVCIGMIPPGASSGSCTVHGFIVGIDWS